MIGRNKRTAVTFLVHFRWRVCLVWGVCMCVCVRERERERVQGHCVNTSIDVFSTVDAARLYTQWPHPNKLTRVQI